MTQRKQPVHSAASRRRAKSSGSSSAAAAPLDPAQEQRYHLARIRHELRTPINHIIGYSEMLQEEAGDRIQDSQTGFFRDLQKIHAGGKQLLTLISDLFDAEKFDARKWDLHELLHQLRTPVTHIIGYTELLQEQAAELGQETFIPDLEKIHIAATNWLALVEGHLIHTFVDQDKESAKQGPRMIRKPEVSLPAALIASLSAPKSARLSPSEQGSLLVVDDDLANREMLSRRLQRQGYAVSVAENGQAALKMVRSSKFDLVLLDMIMPGLDGCEVLQALKSDDHLRHIPVLMISALDDVDGIVRCIELGAEDYLSKPFNPVFLRARIGAALEKKRLRDQEQIYLQRIQEEQRKSERLLLNVLPKAIAERLKQGETAIVDSFPEVTVLFADLVGFTSLSVHIAPSEVVQLLNEVFSAFDLLASKHGLEKIKTIGDAYMAVSGLPSPREDHARAAADLALDMLGEIEQFNRGYRTSLRIRIGMNTGPVIAGIIGRNKFIYDLWGDTVNTASRMESHGFPGSIQVTEATYERLQGEYLFKPRGPVEIKGKGEMNVYLLLSKKTRR